MEKRNSQLEHGQPVEQEACFACTTQCGSLSITTPVSLLQMRLSLMFEAYCTGK